MLGTEAFVAAYGGLALVWAGFGTASGGFAKGVVGFALPLVALGIMGTALPFEVAVALLVLPTLTSNLFQALRNGLAEAWGSFRKYWRLNLILVATIAVSAQLVVALPDWLLYALLGTAITGFGTSQLVGWTLSFRPEHRLRAEVATALVGGFFGGLSGIWGPPIVMYLLAAATPKVEALRAQSLSFLLGSLVLFGAHLRSGILDGVTLPVSAWMILPTMSGMLAGYVVQDRLDQVRFRQATLIVLVLTGLNLLRRAAAA
jgi:uncharacterized protein